MSINEFRQDIVSGEWVLFATDRAKRGIKPLECEELNKSKNKCPFEDLEGSGNEVLAVYPVRSSLAEVQRTHAIGASETSNGTSWFAKVINNKYPAISLKSVNEEIKTEKRGPFSVLEARGFHEVVVFKEHDKLLPQFSPEEMAHTFKIYKERYNFIAKNCASEYILIFHNQGARAGGTLYHPHSQIISSPVLPPDVKASIKGAERFYLEYKAKVYDAVVGWELKEKKGVVFENDQFVAFCPFASKTAYETRIFPKEGNAHFESIDDDSLTELGEAVSVVLGKINKALDEPDFNMFIHTSPLHRRWEKPEDFYTWHIEILPRVSRLGGFELGSGIFVNVIDPNKAAELFRSIY